MSSSEIDGADCSENRPESMQALVEKAQETLSGLSEEAFGIVVAASTAAARAAVESIKSEAAATTPDYGAVVLSRASESVGTELRTETAPLPFLINDERQKLSDCWIKPPGEQIVGDQQSFHRKILTRVSAKKITFRNVSFFQVVFDSCYFNNCVFDSCNFIGCRFTACNLHQSTFPGCQFDYAIFERSQVGDDILRSTPERNNLKLKFARVLRMNFQQMGDARAVNEAILVELEATDIFLKESWCSSSDYYRNKYSGFSRVKQFCKWLEFRSLDLIWGNGESIAKLLRSIVFIVLVVGLIDAFYSPEEKTFSAFVRGFTQAPALFLGVKPFSETVPALLSSSVAALRLVSFAFLTAILVKRFGRR